MFEQFFVYVHLTIVNKAHIFNKTAIVKSNPQVEEVIVVILHSWKCHALFCVIAEPMLGIDFKPCTNFDLLSFDADNEINYGRAVSLRVTQVVMMLYFMGKELFFKTVLNSGS